MSDTRRLHTAGANLLERARDLRPLIEREADAAEAQGRLTTSVMDALHEAGLFGVWVPVPLGGAESSPRELIAVFEELSYADPSTGWVVMATTLENGTAGAYLGDDAVERIFAGPRMPLVAGQGTRPGTAVRENGTSWACAPRAASTTPSTEPSYRSRSRTSSPRTSRCAAARSTGSAWSTRR
ncbi:acyl-CoA dehydrogenase family protein [Nonomuraea sp. B10E15]|uniref:acyl-CoA dehydrogenase family protein n=1 Tax=Nonomuraea sp. B10E15 TaxID=3153560 RepID=UPI00325DD055